MGKWLDSVPLSGIVRIREMMFGVENPFRLDQGDVSFSAPQTFKDGIVAALRDDDTHYSLTAGLPRLRELVVEKLRTRNGITTTPDKLLVCNGGIHGLYVVWQCLLEPDDEVILPDPWWPPVQAQVLLARGVPVGCPLREELGWRWDLDELARKITPKTRVIYVNSPHNPTGGMMTREDLEAIVRLAHQHDLTIISDEAYEDYAYASPHVSIASLPGAAERTISVFTFSKSYAVTGLRLGYVVSPRMHDRMQKLAFYTASNVCTAVQRGGIAALEAGRAAVDAYVAEIDRRRALFFRGIEDASRGVFTGAMPAGGVFAFLRVADRWRERARHETPGDASPSWAVTEYLIKRGRIGCVPGVDFGACGEGYVRFCLAREPAELTGALQAMREIFL
ncbi:MAG TPA: pyridoxal phosphate-dependent aminotransferase [Kofleriaceae bacterium]|nr:pyridoxal phosphate-dependent aminotransferase [Kofleriaceae bacterium]